MSLQKIAEYLFPAGNFAQIRATSPDQRTYNIDATRDLVQNQPALFTPFAPIAAAGVSLPYDAMQAAGRITESDMDRAMQSGALTPRDIASEAFGLAYDRENPLSSAIQRTQGATLGLADRLQNAPEFLSNLFFTQAYAPEVTEKERQSIDITDQLNDYYTEGELYEIDDTGKIRFRDRIKSGIETLKDELGPTLADYIRGGGIIGRGITSIANLFGDTFKGSRFYNPRTASGNRLFAPGARAGDRANLGLRRDARRFANMINRLAAGKRIGRSNLEKIMAKRGLTGIDVEGMAQSIRDSRDTGYGGYGSAEAAAAEAAASGGRDYSSSPGAMAGDMEYGEE